MAPTVLSARAMGYPAADKNRVLVRRFDPVQIRKNPAAGRTSKPRGQATDMEVAFIARGIPAHHPCWGRGAVSRKVKKRVDMSDTFYMMWVAGRAAPKKLHPTIESAKLAIQAYKDGGGTREAFVLGVVHHEPGRKLLKLKSAPRSCVVEPKTHTDSL